MPTIAESGLPGYAFTGWMGLLAPLGVPRRITDAMHAAFVSVLHEPQVAQRLRSEGAEAVGGTPAQFKAFLASELAKWTSVARQAGIRLD